ncbi:olfactory receptor 5V1-like [Bombina bombina]|uniref:olfactory receptor 5V1-like n=1 Tax=Bombina bombina TaxID=8345 RepID=UPI00235AEFAC|nr:olfactory receptor 5V1-like [Bombina bombina]
MREAHKNSTFQIQFHLQAFSNYVEWQPVFFIGILLMYLLAVFGNMMITILVCLAPQLHTPMYVFLCNLAIQDIVYVSSILPKLLFITITADNSISFPGCITQLSSFSLCVGTEFFLLTSMAYDRYVAICIPLRYFLIVNKRVCIQLISASWITGFINSFMQSLLICNLSFCNSTEINHFFCELKTMMKLSCSDISSINTLLSVECVILGFIPFSLIIASYVCIISTILKIKTSSGRHKMFSSCSSHLTIVIIFCGTVLSLYIKPESERFQEQDKLLSMLYIGLVPMLNPVVYSLRNKDVLKAMKKNIEIISK